MPYIAFIIYSYLPTSIAGAPDFMVYYAAAHFARAAPDLLYDYSSYLKFYATLKPVIWSAASPWFGYLGPPSFAVLLEPFSFLSCQNAYLAWTIANLFLCALLTKVIMELARQLKLNELNLFLGSCVWGAWITFNVILKGQFSILACLLLTLFFIYQLRNKPAASALCLSVLLLIKLPLFIPLFLYVAGCRRWHTVAFALLFSCAIILVTLPFLHSPHVWLDYVATMHEFSAGIWNTDIYYCCMINLRSIIWSAFSKSQSVAVVTQAFYLMAGIACFLWPWITRREWDIGTAAAAVFAGIFFTPYIMAHDAMMLLPVGVIITARLREQKQARWMFLCYAMTSYSLANYWYLRSIELILAAAMIWLVFNERRNSVAQGS